MSKFLLTPPRIKFTIFLVAIIAFIFSNISYFYGFFTQTVEKKFMGFHFINWWDMYVYLSYIQQAIDGQYKFFLPFTSEYQNNWIIRPEYTVIGKIAALSHLSSLSSYFISKFIITIIAVYSVYYFLISKLFKRDDDRIIALLVLLFSSGIGLYVKNFWPRSTDLWLASQNTFLTFAESPTFALIFAILPLIYGNLLEKDYHFTDKILLFTSGLIIGFIHLHQAIIFGLAIAIYQLTATLSKKIERIRWDKILTISIGASVGIFYYFVFAMLTQPILKTWIRQDFLPTPNFGYLIVGFGLPIIFFVISIKTPLRNREDKKKWWLIYSWIIASIILLYSPIRSQLKFYEGLPIAVLLVATRGYLHTFNTLKWLNNLGKKLLIFTTLIVFSLTNFYLIYSDIKTFSEKPEPFYMSSNFIAAVNWLKNNSGKKDVIFSNPIDGNLIAGLTARPVFIGHPIGTMDFWDKLKIVSIIHSNPLLIDKNLISKLGINYLFLRNIDQTALNSLSKLDFLTIAYDNNEVVIYKVE